MLLIYFDEVKYQEGVQPYYWIGGIVATPEAVRHLEKAVNELSEECFEVSTLSRDTEFHARDLFHGNRNFKDWKDIERRMSILTRLADIMSYKPQLGKIYVRLEPAKMISEENIEEKAFMFFVEKVDSYLTSRRSPGMLIGDKENDRVSGQFAEKLSCYRRYGTPYQFGMELTHLIDTVHFTNSHHSRMLQLADLYVWLLQLNINSDPEKSFAHSLVINHIRENTDILNPNKYKIWPIEQSWVFAGNH